MAVRGLWLFEHRDKLGNQPAHKVLGTVQLPSVPTARSFEEYKKAGITEPKDGGEALPGVSAWRLSEPLAGADLDDALPLSGLQHLASCPRQWALIHLEQAWAENRLTTEGRLLHERADLPGQVRRQGLRTVCGFTLPNRRLRLTGRADVVEFRPEPYPVEYKRGKRKPTNCDMVQLCAQALCLEEMLGVHVPRGAIFYGRPRRRIEVEFAKELRARTEGLAATMHRLYAAHETPLVQPGKHCRNCSLVDRCLPDATAAFHVASAWQAEQLRSLKAIYS